MLGEEKWNAKSVIYIQYSTVREERGDVGQNEHLIQKKTIGNI